MPLLFAKNLGGPGPGFGNRKAGADAGALVSNVGDPGRGEEGLAGVVVVDEIGRQIGKGLAEKGFMDDPGHQAVSFAIGMNPVARQGKVRGGGSLALEVAIEGSVKIDHRGDLVFLFENPLCIFGENIPVIVAVDFEPRKIGRAIFDQNFFGFG